MFKLLIKIALLTSFFTYSSFSDDVQINIDKLSSIAQAENKHLLLFFHKDGCGYCRKMFEKTILDIEIQKSIKENFSFVDIGIDDDGIIRHKNFKGTKHDYAKSLEISFYPTVGFVDGNNSMVYGTIGYRDKESFKTVLKYVYSKAYTVMNLEAYKTELDFNNDD